MVVQIGLCSVAKHMDNQLENHTEGQGHGEPHRQFREKGSIFIHADGEIKAGVTVRTGCGFYTQHLR